MKTKKVFSILCLFCAGFLLLQPVISMLLMSVKDYKPIAGILNSPYVGLDNMADLLQSPNLIRILRNTIIIQLFAILIGAAYIFVAFRAICALQNKAAKAVGVILFALPAILPVDAYMMILYTFVPSEMLIRSSVLLQIIAGAEHGLRFSAVFVIGALFTNDNSVGSEKKYMILFIAIKLLSILTLDTGFMNSFYNPLTYEHLDTYSTYFYRVGFMQSAFSGCAAGYVVRLLIQFIPAVIGVILLILLLRKGHVNGASIHNTFREPVDKAYRGNSLFMVVAVLPVVLLILSITAGSEGILGLDQPMVRQGYANGIAIAAVSALVVTALGGLLATTGKNLGITGFGFIAFLYYFSDNIFGYYIWGRMLGLTDTLAGVVLQNLPMLFPVVLISALILKDDVNKTALPAVFVSWAGLTFAWFWGEYMAPMIVLRSGHKYSLSLLIHQLLNRQGNVDFSADAESLMAIPYILIPVLIAGACIMISGIYIKKDGKTTS